MSRNTVWNLSDWHRLFYRWSQSFRQRGETIYVKKMIVILKEYFSKLVSFLKYQEERSILITIAMNTPSCHAWSQPFTPPGERTMLH